MRISWRCWLRQAGADLEKADNVGITPLIGADMNGATAAVEWLLARGADWRKIDHDGNIALDCAQTAHGMDSQAAKVLQAWVMKHRTTANGDMSSLPSSTAGDFEVGQQVVIVRLVGRPELNECIGQVQSFDEAKGRFAVALTLVGGSVNVKPSNLRQTSMADVSRQHQSGA